jgi:tRNA-splicing ligase RtcB
VLDLKDLARSQLGTVGSGNHYVDIFEEKADGSTWIGVHFGSRGLGHKTTTRVLEQLGAKDTMEGDPALVDINSDLGRSYLAGIELGGHYAYAGREWVVDQVRSIVGGEVTFSVHNHHNFCWKEEHNGETLYVVRKGATPAYPNQYGFVGGSMGDNAVILRGIDSELSKASMYSTVHGAGRVMSRMAARGKYAKDGTVKSAPRVDRNEWQQWLRDKEVTLIGADLDEAPQAYRRLDEVLAHHEGTVDIEHILSPRGVIMAGSNEFDPYKD